MFSRLRITKAKSVQDLAYIQFALSNPCIRHSGSFTKKEEPRASPTLPFWALATQLNPIRPVLDQINLWRYRRIDPHFRPPEFMDFARQRYFELANAVADEDLNRMKSIMSVEAFEELHQVIVKNRQSEKEAWRRFMKLDPVEHEMVHEKVESVYFRRTAKPFSSAADASQTVATKNASGKKLKLFEIYAQFAWHHDDVPRKELIKMGYRGPVVDRADVFWPSVIAHLKFAKIATSSSPDWLITKTNFLVAFPPARHVGYMARVAKYRAKKQSDRKAPSESGDHVKEKMRA